MAANELDYKQYIMLAKRNKRLWIISSLAIMTIVIIVTYLMPNKYEAKSTVFIEKSVIAELVKGLAVAPSIEDKIKALTYSMTSRTLILKVLDELDLNLKKNGGAEQEKLIKELQDKTQIKIKDKEGLFIIAFQDDNPKLARDYVNILVRRYIEESTSSKREDSYDATKFITEQASVFRDKLQQSEAMVNTFKQGEGSVATMDPSVLLKDINDSQQRVDELKIKEAQLETVLSGMNKGDTAQSNLPVLRKRLQELQLQYTDNYPEIIRIKDEIKALEVQSKNTQGRMANQERSPEYEKLASELRAIRQAIQNLNANISRNRGLLQRIPAVRSKLDDMEREKNSQKAIYEQMMARQGQSEVSKQMEVQDKSTIFRIVDAAVLPIKPISPNRVRLIFYGIVAGIAGGFGLLLLKDMLDRSIKNVDMAKQLGVPLLAVIPRIEEPLKLAEQRRSDLRLYVLSGIYFMGLLALLVMEILDVTIISRMIGKLYL